MSDVFYISIATIGTGFLALSMRMCLRSKCDKIECFCLKIHRNTEQEIDVPEPHPPSPQSRGGSDDSMKLENIYRL